ncbi:glycerol kinase GlpK [Geomonas paludis]|uniref:Glycerol kinase n=1 Tax=Geomonas paludis TaxID=2740185 RepID=A0A6V8N0S0_9BACT|nr:glycerol kinase GlpK [Geomonas paludis]UPU35165.1 glycerol kinase GlpK [Geomonas paludis]GFO65487.1 glycerol kinase [Geomonas paludis]
MSQLLSIDQGTTSSRATLYGSGGEAVATFSQPLTQHYPQPGWVEHDPEEIWAGQLDCVRRVLSAADRGEVAGIGITNQRETTVIWERATGRALHNAIVWQDRRTAEYTEALKREGVEPMVRQRTGLLLDPYFSASKLAWLLDNVPGLRARCERGEVCFGTVDSWLIFRLTGGKRHVTDLSNASRTMLFNIETLAWDEELLRLFKVPGAMLPEVLVSAAHFGSTSAGVLGAEIPITGVAGDQQAALFGQGCFTPGMAKATFGTGAFVVMNCGARPASGEGVLATIAWQLPGEQVQYALEGSIFIAGAAVQWLQEGLGLIAGPAEVEALARSVADSGGVYFVPALSGLGTPYWDPYARGVIAGLTRGSGKAQLARAALEAIAFQTVDAIRAMEEASGIALSELRVDGGATRNDLLLEIQADLLGTPVLRPRCAESTSLGAAFLAGIGAGVLDTGQIGRQWALDRRFEPKLAPGQREEMCRGWKKCVQLSLGWAK